MKLPGWWPRRSTERTLNLALQGGGAHGAFTWGVLEALAREPGLVFEGVSGSSAGAINAVLLADGWMKGGREGACRALDGFWTAIGAQLPSAAVTSGDPDTLRLSMSAQWFADWAGHFSPAQFNPLALNPLRDLLADTVDFKGLQRHSPFKLFIGTTRAHTAQLRVFRENELTLDVLLASACLPRLHHAVEIDGEPYWDGGYSANPAVFPLFYDCTSADVLLVLLAPLASPGALDSVEAIEARIGEVAFTAAFMREMRMFVRAAEFGRPAWTRLGALERRLANMRFHMIDSGDVAILRRPETRVLAHTPLLARLREQGVERGAAWLAAHLPAVGRHGTLDLAAQFSG